MTDRTRKWARPALTAALLCITALLSTDAQGRASRPHHRSVIARSHAAVGANIRRVPGRHTLHVTRRDTRSDTGSTLASSSLEGIMVVQESTGNVVVSNNTTSLFNPASNVKVPTALWAVRTWGPDYRFTTEVSTDGTINADGALHGNLYVSGRYMLFGEKHGRQLARLLARMGITSVKGNLIVSPEFSMDLHSTGAAAGEKLMATLDPHHKTPGLRSESGLLPDGTPEVAIKGSVKVDAPPATAALLATHNAPPLKDILKIMLCHSDNNMAERFGAMLGGPAALRTFLIESTGIDASEVQLASTSGLFVNRLSPQAMMKILQAFEAELKAHQLSFTDLLAVAGVDDGTLRGRFSAVGQAGSVVGKTGTLPETDLGVSTLSGQFNTNSEGTFLFVIFHMHGDVHRFRARQNSFVTGFQKAHSGARPFVYTPILRRIEGENFWN